jgi:hypothetical protein
VVCPRFSTAACAALQWQDVECALADMLGAGGKLGARMLGADHKVGFATAV